MRLQFELSLKPGYRVLNVLLATESLIRAASALLRARFALPLVWYLQDGVTPIIRPIQWQNIRSLVFLLTEKLAYYERTLLEYAFSPTLAKSSVSGLSSCISWIIPFYGPHSRATTLEIEIKNGSFVEMSLQLERPLHNDQMSRKIREIPPLQLVESAVRSAPQVPHFCVVLPLEWYHQDSTSDVPFETQWNNVKSFVLAARGSSGIVTIPEVTLSVGPSKSISSGAELEMRIKEDRAIDTSSFEVLRSRGSRSPYLGLVRDFVRQLVELLLRTASKQSHFLFVFPLQWYEQDEILELLLATQWHTINGLTLAVEESSEEVTLLDYSFSPTWYEASLSGVHTMVFRVLEKLISNTVATTVETKIHRNIFQESLPKDFFSAYNGKVSKSLKSFSIHILDWSFEDPEVGSIIEKLHFCAL